jgi:hypothetical protein
MANATDSRSELDALDESIEVIPRRAAGSARPADGDKSFLEKRLSKSVVEGLESVFGGQLVRECRKLVPLPGWSPQPGPIDVAVVTSTNEPRVAFELKVDDVEWTLWDAYKMISATELDICDAGYLVVAMPAKEWKRARECVELFREPARGEGRLSEWYSSWLFREYAKSWSGLLAGGTGRLREVADLITTTWIGRWRMAHYPGYELRAVRVAAFPDGRRLEFEGDWPTEPRGMEGLIPSSLLQRDDLPGPDAPEHDLQAFALTFDGYREFGSTQRLAGIANAAIERWRISNDVPTTLDVLRGCLFFEQRRWHHFGESFDDLTMLYIHDLIAAMRHQLGAS